MCLRPLRPRVAVPLLTLVFALLPAPARAEEFYYILVFGSDSTPRMARYSHSWAVVARASGCGPNSQTYHVDYWTISWLPATLRIRTLSPFPEPGVNLDLHSTFRWALERQHVSMWGPYQIRRELFEYAVARVAELQSGCIKYRAVDTLRRHSGITDCIHAVTDMDPEIARWYAPLIRYGEPASYHIVHQLFRLGRIENPCADHSWLVGRLGLHCYPICHRQYQGGPTPLFRVP